MATYNKFNQFVQDVANKKHDLSADTLKVMLSNTVPVATNSILSDITEIAAGNGYTAGGTQATTTSSTQTAGTEKLIVADVVFTASGGSIGPFRYAVFYNATQTSPNKPLIGWHDYGSSISLNAGETFTWDADQTAGILTIA